MQLGCCSPQAYWLQHSLEPGAVVRIIHDLKQDQVDVVEHPSECVTVAMRVSEGIRLLRLDQRLTDRYRTDVLKAVIS